MLSRVGMKEAPGTCANHGFESHCKVLYFSICAKKQNCGSVFMLGCVWYARKLPTKIGLEALVEIVVFYIKL